MTDLRYPVGPWQPPAAISPSDRTRFIDQIAAAPRAMRQAVAGLSEAQLETPYRDGGWTVRQVVHHVPDSHMNAYLRMKFGLTEHEPQVKPYDQSTWAETPEVATTPISVSLDLLDALHDRWVRLMRGMKDQDYARLIKHPEWSAPLSLDMVAAHYAWHGRHHVGHITELRKRKSW
jgi:uncharacterized damage-inducible protein DinB